MKLLETLGQPYPCTDMESSGLKKIKSSLLIGLFISIFLLVFQPFGISNWHTELKFFYLIGFGLVTSLVLLFLYFVVLPAFPAVFAESGWTVVKEIVLNLFIVLLITFGNFIYGFTLGLYPLTAFALLASFLMVLPIAIFPILFFVFMKYKRALKKYSGDIKVRKQEPQLEKTLCLFAENEKDKLELRAEDLLFISSADNYADVHYLKNGEEKNELLRGSLSSLEKQIGVQSLARCHRSFIVNLAKVERVTGNAQGYKLHLKDIDRLIPVARKYSELVANMRNQKL